MRMLDFLFITHQMGRTRSLIRVRSCEGRKNKSPPFSLLSAFSVMKR